MFKSIKKFIDDNELWDAEFFLAALGTNIAIALTAFLNWKKVKKTVYKSKETCYNIHISNWIRSK